MIDSELQRFIRQEIARATQDIVLNAVTKGSSVTKESMAFLYNDENTLDDKTVSHPYGYASKAPDGTLSVTLRQGNHQGNRTVIAHRDEARPTDIDAGESVIYSKNGYQVRVKNGAVQVGKNGTFETLVVGETLQALLTALIEAIVQHTHLGNLGYPSGVPQNAATFNSINSDQVPKIVAKDGGKF